METSAQAQYNGRNEYLSPNEAGRMVGVSGVAIKQWIQQRKLPASRLPNGYWQIRQADLGRFMRARKESCRKRILIVGDDRKLNADLIGALDAVGHRCIPGHNPVDALLKAAEDRPSLIIVDVTATRFDGWDLLKRFRRLKGMRKLPLILIGGNGDPARDVDRALAVAGHAYLQKPLEPALLVGEVSRIFAGIV